MEITRIPVEGYEEVYRAIDDRTGLKAFIAVHDTTLGPTLGGCRMWHYSREEDAVTDVLRLSRGMTFKSAVARTGLGGGKAVIVGDPKTQKTEQLFRSMGRMWAIGFRYRWSPRSATSMEASPQFPAPRLSSLWVVSTTTRWNPCWHRPVQRTTRQDRRRAGRSPP